MMYLPDWSGAIPDCIILGFLIYQAEAITKFCEWQNKSQININNLHKLGELREGFGFSWEFRGFSRQITQVVRHFAVFAKVFGKVLPLFDSRVSGGGGEEWRSKLRQQKNMVHGRTYS
jgi:hypothetical protein